MRPLCLHYRRRLSHRRCLTYGVVAVLFLGVLSGCGHRDEGPTAADVVRQQQRREAEAAAKPRTLDERLRVVSDYLDNRNPAAAAVALRPLLISDGSHPDVIVLAARVEAAQGNPVAAAKMLIENPGANEEAAAHSLSVAAQWLIEAGEYDLAAAPLQAILDRSSADLDAAELIHIHRQLAEVLNNAGRRLAAAPHLDWLAQQGAIREQELFAMIAYGDPFINTTAPAPDFSQRLSPVALSRAKVLRHEGDLVGATKLTEVLSAEFPQSTGIAAFHGRLYADLRDMDKLVQWQSELPPGIHAEPEYWFALGILMNQQSKPRVAIRCFAEAVKRDPTDRFSYLELSRALTSIGQVDEAECARQKFSSLDETTRLAYTFGRRPGSEAELNRMADLLHTLNREIESIGWRMLAFERFGGSTAEIEALVAQRRELVSKNDPPNTATQDENAPPHDLASPANDADTEAFELCGLRLNDWPLPAAVDLAAAVPGSRPDLDREDSVAAQVPIQLLDVAAEIGIDFQYRNGADMASERVLLHQLTGGGIGVGDFDCDGWPDLYVTQGGGDAFDPHGSESNRLYRNLAGERFTDITDRTQTGDLGYGQGVAVADINQDGFADLVVANIGPNRIFINQGDGTFSPLTLPAWDSDSQWTTSIACGDLSGDALPEIVEVNYVDDPTALTRYCTPHNTLCNPSNFLPASDRIWKVQPDGQINSAPEMWAGGSTPGYGFAAVIANTDGRAGSDLFVANDRIANAFWLSQAAETGGKTEDEAPPIRFQLDENAQLYGCATGLLGHQQGCMGLAAGDLDRNGKIDFHVTNFWDQPADLYLQMEHGFFVHASVTRGLADVTRQTVAWGTQAVDIDRNGWLDLAVLNGHLIDRHSPAEPYQMRPQFFRGDVGGFQLQSARDMGSKGDPGNNYWNQPTLGRTMAVLDWNCDRRPDLVCNHLDVPLALLENHTEGGNSLQLELVGVVSERDAIAAEVTVSCGNESWVSWVTGGDGFLCSNEPLIDIGIGAHEQVDEVIVRWPTGAEQRFSDLPANGRYLLIENDEQAFARSF